MKVQIMTPREAKLAWDEKRINVLNLTHVWPHADYPLQEVGRIVLNENAKVKDTTGLCWASLTQIRIISQKSNRPHSTLRIWYPASSPVRTPFCRHVCSRTRTPTVTVSAPTTSNSP